MQNVAINFPTSPAFYPAVVVRFFGQVTLWSIKEKERKFYALSLIWLAKHISFKEKEYDTFCLKT